MGGTGSGRRWRFDKKDTVEDCRSLDVNWMTREGIFDGDGLRCGGITWTNHHTGETVSSISYELNKSARWLRLQYRMNRSDESLEYKVGLTTSPLPWGGVRWWFTCPLINDSQQCDRRVGKLYLLPGGRYYGCRHCYNLTYTSCQESHQFDRMWGQLGMYGASNFRMMEDDWKYERRMKRINERREQRQRRQIFQRIAKAALPKGR